MRIHAHFVRKEIGGRRPSEDAWWWCLCCLMVTIRFPDVDRATEKGVTIAESFFDIVMILTYEFLHTSLFRILNLVRTSNHVPAVQKNLIFFNLSLLALKRIFFI